MEKEKVLEIEIKKINNEYSAFYPIKMDIDKLTEISDGKILGDGEYIPYITLRMDNCEYDIYLTRDKFPKVIRNDYIEELKQKIDEINKEFKVSERWRAAPHEKFFCIYANGEVSTTQDDYGSYKDSFYELGNYFRTEEEAQKVKNSKEWKDFWAKVRAGEIGGENNE